MIGPSRRAGAGPDGGNGRRAWRKGRFAMTEQSNPPPAAGLAGRAEPRAVDAGRGLAWWTEAWALFTRGAGNWIVMGLVLIVILAALGFVPLLGGLAIALLLPVFAGGWMTAARKVDAGGAVEIGDLFSGFRDRFAPLAVVGALALAASLLITLAVALFGGGAMLGMIAGGMHGSGVGMAAGFGAGMLALLIALLLSMAVTMALWFAPALVVLRGLAPVEAMQASFAACLRNVLPFLVYGVLYLAAAIVASIPFGLGWIVLIPVLMLTLYASFEDVFPA
jgi:hypothetical protein